MCWLHCSTCLYADLDGMIPDHDGDVLLTQGVLGDSSTLQEAHIRAGHSGIDSAIRVAQSARRFVRAGCPKPAQGQD